MLEVIILEYDFFTVSELMKILDIKKSKAYELVNMKGFPAVRLGNGTIRIYKPDFDKWLRENIGKGA